MWQNIQLTQGCSHGNLLCRWPMWPHLFCPLISAMTNTVGSQGARNEAANTSSKHTISSKPMKWVLFFERQYFTLIHDGNLTQNFIPAETSSLLSQMQGTWECSGSTTLTESMTFSGASSHAPQYKLSHSRLLAEILHYLKEMDPDNKLPPLWAGKVVLMTRSPNRHLL